MLIRRILFGALMVSVPLFSQAAPRIATATILEGGAVVIRDTALYKLAEGVALNDEDIIETGENTYLRLEFATGLDLGIGPSTRLQLTPRMGPDRDGATTNFYLLAGWLKVHSAGVPNQVITLGPGFRLKAENAVTVSHIARESMMVFVERGSAVFAPRSAGTTAGPVSVESGQTLLQRAQGKPVVGPRLAAEVAQTMPRQYRDTLARRAQAFKDVRVDPKPAARLEYSDIAHWLSAEPALRGQFVSRWKALLEVPEFRNSLASNIKLHPEWDRLVFPERYRPKRVVAHRPPQKTLAPVEPIASPFPHEQP